MLQEQFFFSPNIQVYTDLKITHVFSISLQHTVWTNYKLQWTKSVHFSAVCELFLTFSQMLCVSSIRAELLRPSGFIFSTGMLCIKLIKLLVSKVRHFSICQTTGCNKDVFPLDNTVHIVPLMKLNHSNAHKLLFVGKSHTSTPNLCRPCVKR